MTAHLLRCRGSARLPPATGTRRGACAGLPSHNASHPALTLVPPSKNTSWRGAKHNSRFLLLPSFPGSHIITGLGRESKPGTRGWEPRGIGPKMLFPLKGAEWHWGAGGGGSGEPPALSQGAHHGGPHAQQGGRDPQIPLGCTQEPQENPLVLIALEPGAPCAPQAPVPPSRILAAPGSLRPEALPCYKALWCCGRSQRVWSSPRAHSLTSVHGQR